MTQREKLIELMLNVPQIPCSKGGRAIGKTYQTYQHIADHLLANGVIVPPCKVGDNVYAITPFGIETFVVDLIKIIGNQQIRIRVRRFVKEIVYYSPESFGKTVFLTRAEAEKALKEREK